jgi:hypothetical protein
MQDDEFSVSQFLIPTYAIADNLLFKPTVGAILSGSRPATPMNIDFMRSNKV